MGEKSGVRAVEALAPKTVIPIHLGIVPRSPLLRTNESPEGFRKRLVDARLETQVRILREGESWECQAYLPPNARRSLSSLCVDSTRKQGEASIAF